jgi:hypothetical protein
MAKRAAAQCHAYSSMIGRTLGTVLTLPRLKCRQHDEVSAVSILSRLGPGSTAEAVRRCADLPNAGVNGDPKIFVAHWWSPKMRQACCTGLTEMAVQWNQRLAARLWVVAANAAGASAGKHRLSVRPRRFSLGWIRVPRGACPSGPNHWLKN